MKRIIIIFAVVLSISHIQLETSYWYQYFFSSHAIYPLLDRSSAPEWYLRKGIELSWWIKYVSDDILLIATYSILCYLSRLVSRKLFCVSCVFLGYHLVDHFMLWYNYRSWEWLYAIELSVDISSVFIIILVKDKKQAIVKSLI